MTVIEYVTMEVRRQGHDTTKLDGIERVGWMLNAWSYAVPRSHITSNLVDIYQIAERIEPHKNGNGFRTCYIRVGNSIPCAPGEISGRMRGLLMMHDSMTPIEFYKEFETIHPFVDGNGRTGKVLLNWLNGTLLSPIFPPSDLFGTSIQNP